MWLKLCHLPAHSLTLLVESLGWEGKVNTALLESCCILSLTMHNLVCAYVNLVKYKIWHGRMISKSHPVTC